MTEEEKEAIENLTNLLSQRNEKQVKITTYDLFGDIETVLNIIQKQDKEIEHWKNGFERELENNRKNTCELLKQDLIIREKDKQIDILKNHIHYKKCKNCGQEFRAKRTDAQYCKKCSTKVNNGNYYKNLSPEQKQKRREQSKLYMRKLRERRKNGTNK